MGVLILTLLTLNLSSPYILSNTYLEQWVKRNSSNDSIGVSVCICNDYFALHFGIMNILLFKLVQCMGKT